MAEAPAGNTIKTLLARVRKSIQGTGETEEGAQPDPFAYAARPTLADGLAKISPSHADNQRGHNGRAAGAVPGPPTRGAPRRPDIRVVEAPSLREGSAQPAGAGIGVAAAPLPDIGPLSPEPVVATAKRLGEILVEHNLVTREQLTSALLRQAASGQLLGRILLDMEAITAEQLKKELERQHGGKQKTGAVLARLGMPGHHTRWTIARQQQFREPLPDIMRDWPFLSQESVAKAVAIEHHMEFFPRTEIDNIPIESLRKLSVAVKEFRGFVPIAFERHPIRSHVSLVIADTRAIADATSEFKDCVCHFFVGSAETTQTIYRKFFARTEETFDDYVRQRAEAIAHGEDLSRATLYQDMFMAMLRHACYVGASDIALHKSHKLGMIRLKVDGVWELFRLLPDDLLDQLYGVMRNNMIDGINDEVLNAGFTDCALDLNVDRKEENARLRSTYADIIDRYVFRVEIGNSVQGKTVTIRINDTEAIVADLNQLGLDPQTLGRLRAYIKTKNGVFILCGPTGSGKTTTLYALMRTVDPLTVSVQTVESPVEYTHGLWQQYMEWTGWTRTRAGNGRRRSRDCCGTPRTSCSMGRRATKARRRRCSARPTPGTWCSPRCTRTGPPRPSNGLRTSGFPRPRWRPYCWACWPSGWCGSSATSASCRTTGRRRARCSRPSRRPFCATSRDRRPAGRATVDARTAGTPVIGAGE